MHIPNLYIAICFAWEAGIRSIVDGMKYMVLEYVLHYLYICSQLPAPVWSQPKTTMPYG